ncbi:hypothetical protein I3J09_16260 [Streptomyces clavuligerus]|uniref:Uncharacterized protein n=1 Tax=Streptomyces clavuligerus TaxID=1901 RepID=B5GPI9_STRCL|nr:hypothetical protein BB341_16040 [Streptomyces clavuligerus]AXU14229.1 hypothetical protein D1794_16730 [Streptomyces clavuligerus]EDY48235.1 hypothetical protein SSCG_01516 [Streptomyces clavuligerus]EFG07557.1 Hypothetical protein SCLAV_2484 [Streptomyces clavuligerus]MBY6304230.1 hypothetical protein [Streptomyces clavuligerus]
MNRPSPEPIPSYGERNEQQGEPVNRDEAREYAELADDVRAASQARARMADGRRIELTVDELTALVSPEGGPGES